MLNILINFSKPIINVVTYYAFSSFNFSNPNFVTSLMDDDAGGTQFAHGVAIEDPRLQSKLPKGKKIPKHFRFDQFKASFCRIKIFYAEFVPSRAFYERNLLLLFSCFFTFVQQNNTKTHITTILRIIIRRHSTAKQKIFSYKKIQNLC